MADDIERLRAALQEAEELAIRACFGMQLSRSPVWRAELADEPDPDGGWRKRWAVLSDAQVVARCPEVSARFSAHIARWDPAVVLRLVERDRQMIVAARIASEAAETLMRNWLEEDGYAPLVAAGARLNALNEGIKSALAFWCPDPTPGVDGG